MCKRQQAVITVKTRYLTQKSNERKQGREFRMPPFTYKLEKVEQDKHALILSPVTLPRLDSGRSIEARIISVQVQKRDSQDTTPKHETKQSQYRRLVSGSRILY